MTLTSILLAALALLWLARRASRPRPVRVPWLPFLRLNHPATVFLMSFHFWLMDSPSGSTCVPGLLST